MKKSEYSKNFVPLRLCASVPSSRSGVALIMVLGLLTVMVILAVAFAVSMRTERLAAANAADNVRARELVHVALARALNDLAVNLGPTGLYNPDGKAYPSWNVTNSYTNTDGNGAARFITNKYQNLLLVKGEATNYIPRALWSDAANADLTNPSNHWLAVESADYTNDLAVMSYFVGSNLMGRVAYLILNCSGLLDANYAGSASATRQGGTNPAEIAIENLEEIAGKKGVFITGRGTDVRYETLAQLNAMGDFYKPATNLFVYSRALPGYWNTNAPAGVGTQVNLSGSASDLAGKRAVITNAFGQAGFSEYEAGVLFSNLIDYVDGDLVPLNFEYCVENVPMINEIIFQCVSTPPPPDNKTLSVYYELWFPFVAGGGTFSFNGQVNFGAITCPTVSNNFLISPGFNLIGPFTATTTDPGPFVPTIVNAQVTYSGQVVDELAPNSILIVISIVNDAAAISLECLDPRLNRYPTDPLYWRRSASPTPILISPWVTGWWTTNPVGDVDSQMYVANASLHSVAELGYLVYTNAPWRTIRLYDSTRHRVLDVFGLSTNASDVLMTNVVYRGLVNCNSNAALDASAAVFAGMQTDQFPGGSQISNLIMPQAQSFAASIFSTGMLTNLSDLGRITPPGATELERESYFRNACGLLNLRQNMFTIIIEAHSASGGNIPGNPAKQRAVAIVWRDPYTGEMFVRHIKWLSD